MKNHRIKFRKAALALSVCLFVLWWALGTGATLAWFSDVDEVRNEFRVGLLKLDVDYKNDIVTQYANLENATEAFTDKALYEPGYTQVVYLRIHNKGDVPFQYKVAVTVKHVDEGVTATGSKIYLPNYLRYGVVFGQTEAEVKQKVEDRLTARNQNLKDWGALDTWSEPSPYILNAGPDPHYAALIIYMPEEVGNEANYRGTKQPRIDLGITVFAQQTGTEME